MPVDDAPEDDDVRQTYNFAPGNHGLVYRADVPDHGAGRRQDEISEDNLDQGVENDHAGLESTKETRYKLQAMKWGRLHGENYQFRFRAIRLILPNLKVWYHSGQSEVPTTEV